MPTRRQIIRTLLVAGAGAAFTGLYTWRVEPHWLEFTYPLLPLAGLPAQLEGKTLAQITDTHVGPLVDDTYIIDSFRRTKEQKPDFVAITGDWISYHGPAQFDQLRRVLGHIPHGRLGTVGILGNHDYGRRWRMTDVADEVARIAQEAGVTVLRNQSATAGGLQFVGVDDLWGPFFDPQAALSQASPEKPTVVLCHNPDAADRPVWGGYKGWILAGHTPRRAVQAAVPAAAGVAGREQALYRRRIRTGRKPEDVYQPWRRTFVKGAIQREARDSGVQADGWLNAPSPSCGFNCAKAVHVP